MPEIKETPAKVLVEYEQYQPQSIAPPAREESVRIHCMLVPKDRESVLRRRICQPRHVGVQGSLSCRASFPSLKLIEQDYLPKGFVSAGLGSAGGRLTLGHASGISSLGPSCEVTYVCICLWPVGKPPKRLSWETPASKRCCNVLVGSQEVGHLQLKNLQIGQSRFCHEGHKATTIPGNNTAHEIEIVRKP